MPHSFNHQALVILGKALGGDRTVGKKDSNEHRPNACEETKNQKEKLPVFYWSIGEIGDPKA
jgi:hypothetical protein